MMYFYVDIGCRQNRNIGRFYAEKRKLSFVVFYAETSKAFKTDKTLNAVFVILH